MWQGFECGGRDINSLLIKTVNTGSLQLKLSDLYNFDTLQVNSKVSNVIS